MKAISIIEIYERFPNEESAQDFLTTLRWGNKPECPYCHSHKIARHQEKKRRNRLQCWGCNKSFSPMVGTIFHKSHLPLRKWFLAICLVVNARNSLSNRQLGRDLGVADPTAWRIGTKIRQAMLNDPAQKMLFKGIVEMDETYIGGISQKREQER